MSKLQNFLENHQKDDFRDLIEKPISDLTGISDLQTLKELLNSYEICPNPFVIIEFNTAILSLVEYDNEFIKYKWLTQYSMFGSIIFMLVFPLVLSNYWLYFGLLLLPLGIMSSSIIKTPFYSLSWLVTIVLTMYALYSNHFEIFGLIIPHLTLNLGLRNGKLLYRDTMVYSAMRNELCFKFLYYIGIVQLYDRSNEKLIKYSTNNLRK